MISLLRRGLLVILALPAQLVRRVRRVPQALLGLTAPMGSTH